MHILYLLATPGIPLGGPSGSSHHVAAMVQAFVDLGHRVSLCVARVVEGCGLQETGEPRGAKGAVLSGGVRILFDEGPGQGWGDRVSVLEVPPQPVPFWGRDRAARETRQARMLGEQAAAWLREDPPDLIYERYCLFSRAGGVVRDRFRVPWLLEVNAPLRLERARYEGLDDDRAARTAEQHTLRAADRLLAVSSPLARYLEAEVGVDPKRISVVANGVVLERFRGSAEAQWRTGEAGTRLGLASWRGKPVVGFVGSLKPWHGVARWVEVLAGVRRRVSETRGLVVGDGPEAARMREAVGRAGLEDAVRFTGYLAPEQVVDALACMDLLLAPYPRIDPFYFCPLKVIEALAAGVPVITTTQGDLPALVGEAGATVDPDNLTGLVDEVVDGLINPELRSFWQARTAAQVMGRDWRDVAETVLRLSGAG